MFNKIIRYIKSLFHRPVRQVGGYHLAWRASDE